MTTRIASSTAAATPGRDSRSWKCRTGNRSKPAAASAMPTMTGSRCWAISICRPARDAIPRWSQCTAADGRPVRAAASSTGALARRARIRASRDQLPAGEEGRGVPAGGSRRARRGAVRARRRRAVRIDPERIGLFGASAGAHLSALAALGGASPIFEVPTEIPMPPSPPG